MPCVAYIQGAVFLPPRPQLACARIGAVHSVVFGGFSVEALAQRLSDARSRVLVTASGIARGARGVVRLKAIADEAMALAGGDGCAVGAGALGCLGGFWV